MKIQSSLKEYEVTIEKDETFFVELCEIPNTFYVIDRKVFDLYRELFSEIPEEQLYLLEATEENKVIETALTICEKITEIPAKRRKCGTSKVCFFMSSAEQLLYTKL